MINGEIRACDICGKSDMPTEVCNSGLGAFSMNYCNVCLPLDAEQSGMEDIVGTGYTTYDSKTDMYIDENGDAIEITIKSGDKFKTRSELVNFINK